MIDWNWFGFRVWTVATWAVLFSQRNTSWFLWASNLVRIFNHCEDLFSWGAQSRIFFEIITKEFSKKYETDRRCTPEIFNFGYPFVYLIWSL